MNAERRRCLKGASLYVVGGLAVSLSILIDNKDIYTMTFV
ncbi:hypothetical protein BN2476_2040015 [Paraburkholderia piptadeniae]|uniref:Uncharacterized protein n=1 Tax=Paraburkholderia piptadeniae TaxID=1701573 RepID=A0A1N7SXQ5_9BURK|nr:hypothetical protein BN2476_2040015 [Paraburkholderia piptadeniae]